MALEGGGDGPGRNINLSRWQYRADDIRGTSIIEEPMSLVGPRVRVCGRGSVERR